MFAESRGGCGLKEECRHRGIGIEQMRNNNFFLILQKDLLEQSHEWASGIASTVLKPCSLSSRSVLFFGMQLGQSGQLL